MLSCPEPSKEHGRPACSPAEQRGRQKACKPCQTVVEDVILGLHQLSHFILKLANRSLNFILLVLVSQTRSCLGIILKVNTPLK